MVLSISAVSVRIRRGLELEEGLPGAGGGWSELADIDTAGDK